MGGNLRNFLSQNAFRKSRFCGSSNEQFWRKKVESIINPRNEPLTTRSILIGRRVVVASDPRCVPQVHGQFVSFGRRPIV